MDWKVGGRHFIGSGFDFDQCFCLNFGYHDWNLSLPQIDITPESNIKLNFDTPINCFFVIVGGKYLEMIVAVMEKVNSVTNDLGGKRPMAVFLISDYYNEHMIINEDYGFNRSTSTPVMVKILIVKPKV